MQRPAPQARHPGHAGREGLLKADLFGTVTLQQETDGGVVLRETRHARRGLRWLARMLAHREAVALARLGNTPQTPALLGFDGDILRRRWIPGQPMQCARPADPAYFREALTLLRLLHRAGVTHNDLAKETNWLVTPAGMPALVDFQLAVAHRRRTRLFRLLAREDLRHLLKHKRTYCPERLTLRQQRILARPALHSRLWMATGKRAYRFLTRRLLGWSDREGAGDRRFS